MKDIRKAYEEEQAYKSDSNPDKVQLVDRLKAFGYETLSDYFDDKRDYLLADRDLKIQHYLITDGLAAMWRCEDDGKSGAFAIDEDRIWAWVGTKDFDDDLAASYSVTPFHIGYFGGTIITSNKDFNIALVLDNEIEINSTSYYLEKMNKFLCEKGYETSISNNDIMLPSGRKVSGSAYLKTKNANMFFMSISLEDHSELVEKLCGTGHAKLPGFISGLTKEQIEKEVNEWLRPSI